MLNSLKSLFSRKPTQQDQLVNILKSFQDSIVYCQSISTEATVTQISNLNQQAVDKYFQQLHNIHYVNLLDYFHTLKIESRLQALTQLLNMFKSNIEQGNIYQF